MLKRGFESLDGIIPLLKPKGVTSYDCVQKLKRMTRYKKIGHTGTLDPNVEGVLTICFGEATKLIPYLQQLPKVYIAEIKLGRSTTTEDATGETIEKVDHIDLPRNDDIDEVLQAFVGDIEQIPPMYSAVKVKGKRLYEYARENIEVKRSARKVTIDYIKRMAPPNRKDHTIKVEVKCSKGTYIRTLAVDIGKSLGYPAHLSVLKRIETDSFTWEDTLTFTDIQLAIDKNRLSTVLVSMKKAMQHMPALTVSTETKRRVLHGQKLPAPKQQLSVPFSVIHNDDLLAIYTYDQKDQNLIKPIRVFNLKD